MLRVRNPIFHLKELGYRKDLNRFHVTLFRDLNLVSQDGTGLATNLAKTSLVLVLLDHSVERKGLPHQIPFLATVRQPSR